MSNYCVSKAFVAFRGRPRFLFCPKAMSLADGGGLQNFNLIAIPMTSTTTTIVWFNNKTATSFYSKISSRLTTDDDEDSFGLHDDDNDYADTGSDEELHTSNNQNTIRRATSSAEWPTKVFAADCVQKLINYFEQTSLSNLHFDYISSKERLRIYSNEDYLVIHLNTLIKFSFISCTSTNIDLPGHFILEQYQAQVGAALRPVFSQDTSSHVTAQACD
ncbi:unnamed protein product, partial [Rotaria sp. Silwood2]